MSDYDWITFSGNILYSLPWLVLHFLGSQVLKLYNQEVKSVSLSDIMSTFSLLFHFQMLPLFYTLLSSLYIFKILGSSGLVFLGIQPLIMYIVHLSKSSFLVYAVSLGTIFAQETDFFGLISFLPSHTEDYNTFTLGTAAFMWINLRCLSFCLDRLWEDVDTSDSSLHALLEMYSYCFYMPVAFGGPIIIFQKFKEGVSCQYY